MTRYTELTTTSPGVIEGMMEVTHPTKPRETMDIRFSASLNLLIIRTAWEEGGLDLEREANGFGPGMGTHGDWTAIRDSSPEAIDRMLLKALNYMTECLERGRLGGR